MSKKPQSNGKYNGRINTPSLPSPTPQHLGSPNTGLTDIDPAYLAEVWAQRAYSLAEPPTIATEGDTLDLLVFLLGGERYGVEVQYVREIYPLQQITPVPRTPDFAIGVFSARGQLISVIDFRAFVGLPTIGLNDNSKIMVMSDPNGPMELGVLADNVEDVTIINQDDIEPALVNQLGQRSRFIQGVAPNMLIVLNMQLLLNDPALLVQEELT